MASPALNAPRLRTIRHLASALLLAGLAALPASVRAQDTPPEGWLMRGDRAGADMSQVFFVDMPPGWHITTGPSGIFYHPEMRASGDYRVEMEVYLFDPEGRRESFGFFVGGRQLEGPGQGYLYFLIRDGGEFLVKVRDGEETRTVQNWTPHPAILAYADRDEGGATILNTLALESSGGELRFEVNGEEVASMDAGTLPRDGIVGLRVNHRLNLHVSRLEILDD